jgi:hypothetical protein
MGFTQSPALAANLVGSAAANKSPRVGPAPIALPDRAWTTVLRLSSDVIPELTAVPPPGPISDQDPGHR